MIYLDYQSTTPIDPIVIEEMMTIFKEEYGNPHSKSHVFGIKASKIVEKARWKIAKTINAHEDEIIFTSGATESNNLALKGLIEFHNGEKNHIITTQIEHKCILEICKYLEIKNIEITYIKPDRYGIIDPNDIKNTIKINTLCVSIIAVNNEIGVIQNLTQIGQICRENRVFFHTDAAQAFGKIDLDVEKMNIDLMSISSHKIYGPKGIGALYVRRKPRVRLSPIIHGGGQERSMRGGTLPVPIIHGFGIASEIALVKMPDENKRIRDLYNFFLDEILQIPETYLNGHRENRYFGNININFAAIEGESLMLAMKEIAVSSGSACTSATLETSHVLRAIDIREDLSHSSIRFGIGRFTTKNDIEIAIKSIKFAVEKLRKMSPLWDMIQNGIDINKIKWCEHCRDISKF